MTLEKENICLQLAHCASILDSIFLQDNVVDKWVWTPNLTEGCMVKDACHILSQSEQSGPDYHLDIIWNKVVPYKVLLFAWRTFKRKDTNEG